MVPKILFIADVYLRDCQNYSEASGEVSNTTQEYVEYDELHKIFRDPVSWPSINNLLCWHCSLPFDSIPVFVPKIIEPRNNSSIMNCEGNFCSFNCAVSFINLNYPNVNDNIEAKNKLKFLYHTMFGRSVKEIPPMPPKYLMRHYGGPMSICQYTELGRSLKNTF